MTEFNCWPANYFASREKFTDLAKKSGARMESHPVEAVGPQGESLTVDVAAFTSSHDKHRIILASGVHGIEGFIGACIQMRALLTLAPGGLPDRVGLVMIHAANPWGFSHLRRVDDHNVDVNRNFIDSSPSTPVSHPQYQWLDPVINPQTAPDTRGEFSYWLNAGKLIVRNGGIGKLFKPIAEGQYDFPKGVFYGGAETGEVCKLLQTLVLKHSANTSRVTLLDVHSGLGPSAVATLIGNSNIVSAEKQSSWLKSHYKQPVYVDSSNSNLYNAQGTFSQWCSQALRDKQFLYLCIEIGTVNPLKLFSALRRENQAHHWAAYDSQSYILTKHALREVFAPNSRRWRSKATQQGLSVINKAFTLPGN